MRNYFRLLLLLPCWFLCRLLTPLLPADHPLRRPRRLTLWSWFHGGTPTALWFGAGLWAIGLSWGLVLWALVR